MEEFENKVEVKKYKSTNALWNKLGLSASWSVGYVSQLIKMKNFKNKEQWYDFYFESGQERLKLISKLPKEEQAQLLNGKQYEYKGENAHLNYLYGRTKEELSQKGVALYSEILKEGNPLNLEIWECQFTAFFRVIAETWNGIMLREKNAQSKIEEFFHKQNKFISLIDTSGKFDKEYAVDFELYFDGEIICGIQVKPESYNNKDISYLKEAMDLNEKKNNEYTKKFKRPVYYVYCSKSGFINNFEVLNDIKRLIMSAS